MIKKGPGRAKSGVVLLFVISILGLLVLIGVSFALNMILTRKEASNYLNSAKARYIAEAGITKAIMDIRGQVASASYANLKTYINGYVATDVAFGGGKYTLTIVSEEGKVNINTFDPEPLTDPVTGAPNTQLTILRTFLTDQQIANIIDYRDTDTANTVIAAATGNIEGTPASCKNKPFDTIQEIIIATGISKAVFDANKDKITVTKPIIRGGLLGKYYKGITNASPNVAIDHGTFSKKVVELGRICQYPDPADTYPGNTIPGTDGDGTPPDVWAETHDAEFAGGSALCSPGDFGINYFGVIWTGYLEILPAEVGAPIDFWIAPDDGARFYIIDGAVETKVCDSWTDAPVGVNFPWDRQIQGTFTFTRPGWYPIRLEYYDQDHYNSVWFKWKNSNFYWAQIVPAERLGYDPPTEVAGGYDHAGMYTITATASVVASGAAVATKQMTAVVEIFDTWTQTTREEFYSAWFNLKGDFSDGEVFNVNWLDSCPTDEDYWDAGISKMHWEGTYQKTLDSVKLGYWDNFDEDPAFSSVMMKGYQWNTAWQPPNSGTLNISYQDFKDSDGDGDNEIDLETTPFEAKHFELNRNYFTPNTPGVFVRAYTQQPAPHTRIAWRGTGTPYAGPIPPKETLLWTTWPPSLRKVYYLDDDGDDVFDGDLVLHTGEQEVYPVYDTVSPPNPVYIINPSRLPRWAYTGIPAPGTYTYWQPEAPFCGCWLFAKGNADDPRSLPGLWSGPATIVANGFKTMLTDGHGYVTAPVQPFPLYMFGDTSEIRLGKLAFFYVQFNYPADTGGLVTPVLSMIGTDNGSTTANYYAWINGVVGDNTATWANWPFAYPNGPIFKFVINNQYLGWDWDDFDRGQHIIGPSDWDKGGALTEMHTLWDNIRCIPESGYLVSVPFYAGSSPVTWGTISYSKMPGAPQTNVNLSYRKTAAPPFATTDSGWTAAAASGAAVGGTESWLQYKAVLTSNAINRTIYGPSSRTPALEDVTITYMPAVQIKYWKEGL